MYETFEAAKAGAIDVIARLYDGEKQGCCVVETKNRKNSRKTHFGFRFNSEDSNGEFLPNGDGSYSKFYKI